jgi:trans-2,3-dihydro-3-hydroxyanthranilate isomerase
MTATRYLHLDVFTDRPFEGNQLAVFPEPGGLTTADMHAITREMNFSECTFILPAEQGGDVRMRIFTPGKELPMAGHPTIGSTFALALEGVIARGRRDFVFELGIGSTPVSLEWGAGGLTFAWMTQPLPSFGDEIVDRRALATALGLDAHDLADTPAQVVSCGVPFLFVRASTRRAVDALSIDRKALIRCFQEVRLGEEGVFVFSTERGTGSETVYSRMLAPNLGVAEDPATGAASGPLGCYMLYHGLVTAAQAQSILSLQGVAMGRPSRIHISIDSAGEMITRVRIGGTAVLVGRGTLSVD